MNDLLDEIYQYIDGATRYDRYMAGLCPFHDDNRPSFFIYPDSYYCKSCGTRGKTANLLDDIRKKQGVFIQKKTQIEFRSPWSRWSKSLGSLETIIKRSHDNLIEHNKTVYLRKRGITIETILKLKIGWLDDWITFPIYNPEGELVGATARAGETNTSTARYCNVPGMSADIIYVPNWNSALFGEQLIVVYGIIDCINLYQLGYASASTTTGKRINPNSFDIFRKKIYIVPDRGEEIEAALLSANLGWRGKAMKVTWPEKCKDVNDVFCRYSKEETIEILGLTKLPHKV